MQSTVDQQMSKLIGDVRWACDQIQDAKITPKEFSSYLLSYVGRIHLISNPPTNLSEKQRDTADRDWQQFTNDQRVIDFCEAHKLTLAAGRQWYWCSDQVRSDGTPKVGEIIGLPGSRGICRITNGVDVWIEKEDGTLYLGHIDWFKGERRMPVATKKPRSGKKVVAEAEELLKQGKLQGEALRAHILSMLKA